MKKLGLLILMNLAIGFAYASHTPGGNIHVECLGNNQYKITLTLFEDCGTDFETPANKTVTVTNNCGLPNPTVGNSLSNTMYQQEISQLCPSQLGLSECNGGTLPGSWMHQWSGIITLPGCCDSWTFAFSDCCQNTSNNVSGQPGYYWKTSINSCTDSCNTTPTITATPIPYVCINQPVNYNLGAIEPNGHTLTYSFVPSLSAATTPVTYNAGFSGTTPITGITIDPNTGQINFTPTTTGNYVVVVQINEYDANGNLVSSMMHHTQFEVINCAGNSNPAIPNSPTTGALTNYVGQGGITGPNQIQVCEGDAFCVDVVVSDPDPGDSLFITSNVTTSLPGATITTSYNGSNQLTATICWTVPPGSNPYYPFVVTVIDDACPISGIQTFNVGVTVISSTYAGIDKIICLNQGVQLQATGGTNFNWSVISGDPITPTNFSCTNCANPFANPAVTTVYEVVSNLSGGCVNIDTVTVTVVPDFTYNITTSSATSCLQDPVNVSITNSLGGPFSYLWTPNTSALSCDTCDNFTVTQVAPGTYTYYVKITSPGGCVKYDSITLNIVPAYSPNVTAMADFDSLPNCGDSVHLNVDFGGGIPGSCGTTTTLCSSSTTVISGTATGQNTTQTFPAPFGNYYKSVRHQFLYTAAELNALGFIGGTIDAIGFPVNTVYGTTVYKNYKVKMGCTNATTLTAWQTGLSQVYGPTNTTISTGVNTLSFTTGFEWDGISNVVVEVCYSNIPDAYTQNSITPWQSTTFNSTLYYASTALDACSFGTASPTISTNRPITHFSFCPSVPDPSNYTFSWDAAPAGQIATLNSTTIQNPSALPLFPTWYIITATDNLGGCSDSDSILIYVECCAPSDITHTDPSCFGANDGTISTTPNGLAGPFTIEIIQQGVGVIHTVPNFTLGNTDVLTGLGGGTYTINTIDTTGCTHDTTITIVEPAPITTVISDTTICETGTAQLTAVISGGVAPFIDAWTGVGVNSPSVSPTVDTCYEVIVTDANGCVSAPDTMCVSINPPLSGTIVASATQICPGGSADLQINVTGGNGGPYSYQWTNGTTNVGTTNPVTVNPSSPSVTYCVTVDDGCGTPTITECVTINVLADPQIVINADITDGCLPVNTQFTNLTDPTLVGSCLWDFGDGSTSTNCDPLHQYTLPGTYDVSLTITTIDGCIVDSTLTSFINVYDYPNPDFSYSPGQATFFDPVITFKDETKGNPVSWLWEFGDNGYLGTASNQNPVFQFPNNNPGAYNVTLYVENQFGCMDSVSQIVNIIGVFTLYMPNAFTPNDDGLNDILTPQGESIDNDHFSFRVFDKWGQLIFETKNRFVGWTGMDAAGNPLKSDVYVWKIETRDRFTGEKKKFYGHVTLIR